jgi:hypothetical protein
VEHDDAAVRVEIGTKMPLSDVVWPDIPDVTLQAAGIDREVVEAGRAACQFPADVT